MPATWLDTPTGPCPPYWLPQDPRTTSIVLAASCTVRRNLDGLPFPAPGLPLETDREACTALLDTLRRHPELNLDLELNPLDLSRLQKCLVTYRAYAKAGFLNAPGQSRRLLVSHDGTDLCRINDRNHLTLVSFGPCAQLPLLAETLERRLAALEADHLRFARHPYFGALCAQAALCGTGASATVCLNLPGLILADCHRQAANAAGELGLRLAFDKENDAFVSHLVTVTASNPPGATPAESAAHLMAFARRLEQHERDARLRLTSGQQRLVCQDKVVRALSTLSSALLLSTGETITALSLLWFGFETGLLANLDSFRHRLLFPLLATAFCQREADQQLHGGRPPLSHQATRAKIIHSLLRRRDDASPDELPLLS